MENFIIMRVQRKIRFLGRFTKNQYIGGGGGGDLKKRGLGKLGNLRESLAKKRGVVFLSKADTPMHTAFLIVSCKFYLLCLCWENLKIFSSTPVPPTLNEFSRKQSLLLFFTPPCENKKFCFLPTSCCYLTALVPQIMPKYIYWRHFCNFQISYHN